MYAHACIFRYDTKIYYSILTPTTSNPINPLKNALNTTNQRLKAYNEVKYFLKENSSIRNSGKYQRYKNAPTQYT